LDKENNPEAIWKAVTKKKVKELTFDKVFEKREEPATTKATILLQEHTKKLLEKDRLKEEQLEKEEYDRKVKQNRMKQRVANSYNS